MPDPLATAYARAKAEPGRCICGKTSTPIEAVPLTADTWWVEYKCCGVKWRDQVFVGTP